MVSGQELISVQVAGVELQIEAQPVAGSEKTSTLDRAQDAVTDAFDRAQEAIVAVATSTVATIGQLGRRSVHPEEVQVEFGLKFTAQGNVIVVGASGQATLRGVARPTPPCAATSPNLPPRFCGTG